MSEVTAAAVCYAKHSHETFSIGAVTGGRSVYLNRHTREWIGAGAVVMMNPDDMHAAMESKTVIGCLDT